jgi:limonene 1,2-monooxygenase
LEIGYFTMPLHPAGSNLTETLDADLEQLVFLDGLGFREAWIGEHFTAGWENIAAPDPQLKAIPSEKYHPGDGGPCLPDHDPFVLAHRIVC